MGAQGLEPPTPSGAPDERCDNSLDVPELGIPSERRPSSYQAAESLQHEARTSAPTRTRAVPLADPLRGCSGGARGLGAVDLEATVDSADPEDTLIALVDALT